MPQVRCPKCVSFAICEHRKLSQGYIFRLKCDGCNHFGEKTGNPDQKGKCHCPFCGQIELN